MQSSSFSSIGPGNQSHITFQGQGNASVTRSQNHPADKRAKPTLPQAEPEAQSEAQQLLSDSYRKPDSRPKGASNDHVAERLAGYKTKPEFKGKYQQLLKYVTTVQELFQKKKELPKTKWWKQPLALDWTVKTSRSTVH